MFAANVLTVLYVCSLHGQCVNSVIHMQLTDEEDFVES